jgi:hypothetical protein
MADKKISELTLDPNPPASAQVPVRDGATNSRVTIQNVVKAGVSAGGVGLASVATTGSYNDLIGAPSPDSIVDGGNF